MKVLSLFDGMACGMLAMLRTNVDVGRYVAFEIDPYATKTSSHNFPAIEHRGNVFNADFTEFNGVDYLIGGSPCTYWSIAQKNGRETEASGMGWELFSQYVRALREAHPLYFIYENNKSMSNAIRESITETFGFEPICINSALVSAQNRQRLYWVGKRNLNGTYSRVYVDQPEDKGILLRDILDGLDARRIPECGGFEQRIYNDNPKKQQVDMIENPVACRCRGRVDKNGNGYAKYECRKDGKANTLDTNTVNGAMVAIPVVTTDRRRSMAAEPVCVAQRGRYTQNGIEQHYEARDDGKTNVLTTVQKDNQVCEPVRVGALPRPNGELSTSQAFRVYAVDGKSVNITAGGGGAGGKTGLYAIPVEFDGETPTKATSTADGKTYTVYRVENGQITIKGKQYPIKLEDGFYIIRKLTVKECMRLQTIPEWYEFPVSDSQAYKMLGNGWTVDVIAHLIAATRSDNHAKEPQMFQAWETEQISLLD